MRLNRLYSDAPLNKGSDIELEQSQGHYLRHVLRLEAGDGIILFDGSGGEHHAEIQLLSKQRSVCRLLAYDDVEREMACRVHIVQAACPSDKIEIVLQKGTELGAAGFQIAVSERSALRLNETRLAARLERWRRIIIEAAEQSGRTRIPQIFWRASLNEIETHGAAYALHPQAGLDWTDARRQIANTGEAIFAVGPEGGWSPGDLDKLEQLGFQGLCFGPRIMRTETAAPALLAAVQAILD